MNDDGLSGLVFYSNLFDFSSVEEVKRHLGNIKNLRNLTLHDNPIARLNSYRVFILASMRQLNSLDSIDRSNRRVNFNNAILPGIEDFAEYLTETVSARSKVMIQ